MLVNKHFYCCIVARGIHSPVAWALSSGHRKEKDPSLTKSDPVRPIAPTKKASNIYTNTEKMQSSCRVSDHKGDEKRFEKIEGINTPRCFDLLGWLTAIQNTIWTDHKQEFYKPGTTIPPPLCIKPQTTVHYHLILNVF